MTNSEALVDLDNEIEAMGLLCNTLVKFDAKTRARMLLYVQSRLKDVEPRTTLCQRPSQTA